ncbi:hypothetical protein [Spiroplasma sp. SV19]|nr:hypothetical protein [Spiroplasma sp. SV19]
MKYLVVLESPNKITKVKTYLQQAKELQVLLSNKDDQFVRGKVN